MYIVSHAGLFYGPFKKANDAAAFTERAKLAGPWTIAKLLPFPISVPPIERDPFTSSEPPKRAATAE